MSDPVRIARRDFLRTGLAGGAFAIWGSKAARGQPIALIVDPSDPIASAPAAKWAAGELARTLADAGHPARVVERLDQTSAGDLCILVSGHAAPVAAAAIKRAKVPLENAPESFALFNTALSGRDVMLACGSDARGLSYALLELVDRMRLDVHRASPVTETHPIVERPANSVRSVMRQFTSEILDKPWFNDREMWPRYLTMLASHRFNRLHLGFGLGYDFLQQVTDSYFLFLYPFLLDVPGYNVRATNLPNAERDRNLEMLRFISEQTVARGMVFQLGVWMHGYELMRSPTAQHLIEGITPDTHAPYCRDALAAVLRACPAISSVALRIHGESGVAEGSYDFWQTIFDGVRRSGRIVEIDLHAKGIDQTMIDRALATGLPVNVSAKCWAEHLGMPYHQAAIRNLEMPVAGQTGRGLMTLSEGSRSFTRYGYADLLRDDRKYTVRHRVFAGTQRLLLSGDPVFASAYSRAFQFCGSTGMDLMEPLTCRGRRGTGVAATRRSGYAEQALEPRWDWEKYSYWYRVWGRLTYNPEADASGCRREFGDDPSANAMASCLAQASRILPIVTTAHLPSAACDAYWPEVYWNQPIVEEPRPNPYGDSPPPKTFQHASPHDPQLFSTGSEHADELLKGDRSGKDPPIDVAQWLEDLSRGVVGDLASLARTTSPEAARLKIDAQLLALLGQFFAAKFRAGVLYAIHEHTGNARARDEAVKTYRQARDSWAELCKRASGVYAADLSASDKISERGQWADRLAAIDDDIARMAERVAPAASGDERLVNAAIQASLGRPQRVTPPCRHVPPRGFRAGAALPIEVTVTDARPATSVACYYRHVNQAERFERVDMHATGSLYSATIPAAYSDSPYPLQYYFVVKGRPGDASLFPGLGAGLTGQPYFVLRRS